MGRTTPTQSFICVLAHGVQDTRSVAVPNCHSPFSRPGWGARGGGGCAASVRDVCGPESDMPCPPCVCFITSKAKAVSSKIYIIKAKQSTVQRRVLSTKGQSCLSAAELVMGHPRNPTAYYLASTLLAYRRLRPKSVHTCSCRCEHKGFAVSTQLLRLHLPVKCEQRILNQRSP